MIASLILCCLSIDGLSDANTAYREGRFGEAIKSYEIAQSREPGAAFVSWYNMGNCAYRMGDPAEALLYYLRAQRINPRDKDLEFNIRLVEDELSNRDHSESSNELDFIFRMFTDHELLVGAGVLQLLGLISWILLKRGNAFRTLAPWMLGLGLILSIEVVYRFAFKAQEGVILLTNVAVRVEPHPRREIAFVLGQGARVRVHATSDRWALVRDSRGKGWVPLESLGLVFIR